MHLLPLAQGTLDADPAAVDVAQTPADIVVLSFSDGELAGLAAAVSRVEGLPSLRLAGLRTLQHPFSVDLYVEKVAARARLVLVRALGGLDYWRYGLEELGAAARRHRLPPRRRPGLRPGRPEARRAVDAARGGPAPAVGLFPRRRAREPRRSHALHGGPHRARRRLGRAGLAAGRGAVADAGPRGRSGRAPTRFSPSTARRCSPATRRRSRRSPTRSHARGLRVTAVSVTSLKDAEAAGALEALMAADPPDVVLNTTAFSARRGADGTVLDRADAPVLQVVQSGSGRDAWAASDRGLRAADLAMNVVLPEVDGRIAGGRHLVQGGRCPRSAARVRPGPAPARSRADRPRGRPRPRLGPAAPHAPRGAAARPGPVGLSRQGGAGRLCGRASTRPRASPASRSALAGAGYAVEAPRRARRH